MIVDWAKSLMAVHPRVRGEQDAGSVTGTTPCGSSPRARGTGHVAETGRDRSRFIPACAGNRPCRTSTPIRLPVHPRVRGEQRLDPFEPVDHLRFIPACAGNRPPVALNVASAVGSSPRARGTGRPIQGGPWRWTGSSPRARGTVRVSSFCASCKGGSSPRARGTDFSGLSSMRRSRFIPACAGNRIARATKAPMRAVHPRVRGEQPDAAEEFAGQSRFIPACAGNRRSPPAGRAPRSVHPRVRGEQGNIYRDPTPKDGSSPRARGTGGTKP